MTYDELNHTNPYNYFPTGDSAKFELPEDKVTKFRRLWRKHYPKKKQDDFTANEPVSMPPTETDKMIVVGGVVGESTLDRHKHLASIAQEIWNQPHLIERKRKRKGKTKNPSVVPNDDRAAKVRRLMQDVSHWPNLE
jgi:hypothetical protein